MVKCFEYESWSFGELKGVLSSKKRKGFWFRQAAKWLWHFPLEPHFFRHRVIQSKYGPDKNGDANIAAQAAHSSFLFF